MTQTKKQLKKKWANNRNIWNRNFYNTGKKQNKNTKVTEDSALNHRIHKELVQKHSKQWEKSKMKK